MHHFKDTSGQSWELSINLTQAKRLESQLHIGLIDESAENTIAFAESTLKQFDALWILVQNEAASRGIDTQEKFEDLLDATCCREAMEALRHELDFFTQNFGQRTSTNFQKILSKHSQMSRATVEAVAAVIDGEEWTELLQSEKKRAIDDGLRALRKAIGNGSTKSLELSESTLDR